MPGLALAATAGVAGATGAQDSQTTGSAFFDKLLCFFGSSSHCESMVQPMDGDPFIRNRPK